MITDLWSDLKNKQQEEAILHNLGPCLIIAGPGSGKTKVMVRRYLNLVLNHNIKPENILLTTFTDKAVEELINKVTNGLKKHDYAIVNEELNIGTIHSFCYKFLKKYLDIFPDDLSPILSKGFRILNEEEQLLFIYQNLPLFGTISIDEIQAGKGWQHAIKLSSFFNKCTEEGVTWEKIQTFVDGLPDKDKNKDKLWMFGYAFEIYEELLKEHNVLDFSHIQTKFFEAMNMQEKILEDVRSTIKYLMVDEFQDTNYIQLKIFRLISEAHKNLMVVGDDDQSIYRFRGAVVENILSFEKFIRENWGISDFRPIYLSKNFRSTPMIVKNSMTLIKNNIYRFEKKLEADKSDNDYKHPFWIHGQTDQEEAQLVANYIHCLFENNIVERYSDIGILFRSVGNHAATYIEIFDREKIPVEIRGGNDFLYDPLVNGILGLFWAIYMSKDSIATEKNEKLINNIILNLSSGTEKVILGLEDALLELDDSKIEEIIIDQTDLNKIRKLREIHLNLSGYRSVLNLFYDLLKVDDLLHKLISDSNPSSVVRMRGISQLSRFIFDFDNYSGGESHPSEFLRYINALDSSQNIGLEREKVKDAVSLYTIHQAKGLEWPIVIIGNAIDRKPKNIKNLEDLLYPIYERTEVIEPSLADEMENRRVYYVAMTRAKEAFGFTTCKKFGETKIDRDVIQYMKELSDDLSDFYKITDEGGHIPLNKIRNGSREEDEIEKKIISFTQLSTYLICPKQYLLLREINFATVQIGQFRFGSNIHGALEDIHKAYRNGKTISDSDLKSIFDTNWISFGFRSPNVEENFRKGAWKLIQEYFSNPNYNLIFDRTFDVERPFTIELDNCFLSGRIDLINKLDNDELEVIDFKVGTANNNEELHKLQLQVYVLALQQMGMKVRNMAVRYISNNCCHNFEINQDEINKTKRLIELVVNKIKNNEFDKTPGEHCNDCAFKQYCID